ncbi:MAG: glycoside hydrolase family 99-like domain-containing protein, partial [Verrucomicrobiota bacterium]|nr:glycoside hydrolase family 99-like domain-containing protein [Verrucomicrobiota bacterium]
RIKARMDKLDIPNAFVTINAWNEWTEGSYLEPDTKNGMGYLEAIRDVFGTKKKRGVLLDTFA